MLVVEDVERTYAGAGDAATRALAGVSLDIAEREFVALMGPSGCGKSTLLTLAGGLQAPDAGSVSVAGVDLATLTGGALYRHRRRHIGYVFQEFNLIDVFTVAENVALPLELDGMSPRRARRRAETTLEQVGLAGMGGRYPATLSGGQRQRVAFARAVCGRARLIIADEPTGALDTATEEGVLDLLDELRAQGATCLVATHSEHVASRADRIVRMRDGRVTDAPQARV